TIERKADATANVISVALGGGGSVDAAATISGNVQAYVDGNATIDITGAVNIHASSTSNPTSIVDVGQGGALSGGFLVSEVKLTTTTSAFIGDNATVTNAGSLDLLATDTSAASVTGTVEGGALGEARSTHTIATINPTVEAYIGKNVDAT